NMHYCHEARSRLLNGRPCWLDSMIALPRLEFEPYEDDPSRIYLRICHGARGVWLELIIPKSKILSTIEEWEADPEDTFMRLFALHEWPRGLGSERLSSVIPLVEPSSTKMRAEDLL